MKVLSACIQEFPFYTGDLDVSTSRVLIKFDEEDMEFKFNLRGAEKECIGCGLHIHSGTSCEDIKDHFYNDGVENPWSMHYYSSDNHGRAKGSNVVSNGYGVDENEGHAVVIHGSDGTPYGCGILSKSREAAESCPKRKEDLETCIQTYPGYEGDLHHVAGEIRISFKGPKGMKPTHQQFRYNLKNAETDCEDCSIHVHSGDSCDDEAAIGDHFHNPSYPENPWANGAYKTFSNGKGTGVFWMDNGYGSSRNNGKVVVLYAKDGTRYGCGVLSTEKAKGCLKHTTFSKSDVVSLF